jgi:hypothetical protein
MRNSTIWFHARLDSLSHLQVKGSFFYNNYLYVKNPLIQYNVDLPIYLIFDFIYDNSY